MRTGRSAAMITVIGIAGSAPRTSGARMLVYDDGEIVGTVGGGTFEYRLIEQALAAIKSGMPRRYAVHLTRDLGMCCGGSMEAFVEPLKQQERLVIYGAGHVGAETAAAAARLGFAVTVVDDRDEWLTRERFSPEINLIEADPLRVLETLPWGAHAFHFVVTHSHQLDQDLIERILPRPAAWLGMIGSRSKVAKFLIRLRAAGMDPSLFDRLCAPVGLDIGAETPEEIAVSVVAELIRIRRGCERTPVPLSAIPLPARGGAAQAAGFTPAAASPRADPT
ncbi:MAG: xanthine dehydrogenase accessory protein XdhC [Myxococcota bacterium]|nr:xanthine dehydrogenase accessory protein XdhC [Myxococcota bacterium]